MVLFQLLPFLNGLSWRAVLAFRNGKESKLTTLLQTAENRHFSWLFHVCCQTHKESQIKICIYEICLVINGSYFFSEKMVDHLYKATTGCIIKITLVALAFDDRVNAFLKFLHYFPCIKKIERQKKKN